MQINNTFGVEFDKIIIIESLPDYEIEKRLNKQSSGEYLKNEVFPFCNSFSEVNFELIKVNSKVELIKVLNKIADETNENSYPFLHFEIHGRENQDGLTLNNNDIMKWGEFLNEIRPINIKCLNNLFIFLAVCSGAHIIKDIIPDGRPFPYYAMIGPDKPDLAICIEEKYSIFYMQLLIDCDAKLALSSLNDNPNGFSKMVLSTTEYSLYKAFLDTIKTYKEDAFIKEYIDVLLSNSNTAILNIEKIKKQFIKSMDSSNFKNRILLNLKNKYLLAHHPKNINRFKFTVEELESKFRINH